MLSGVGPFCLTLSNRNHIYIINYSRNSCNGYVAQTIKYHKVETVRVLQYAPVTYLFTQHTLLIPQGPLEVLLRKPCKKNLPRKICPKKGRTLVIIKCWSWIRYTLVQVQSSSKATMILDLLTDSTGIHDLLKIELQI